MPFIKKKNSQAAQSSSTFIGRAGEVLFFVHNILQPETPTHNILSVSGQGGVGKSTLLARFIAEAHEAPFKDYCLTANIDERQTTPISIMEKFGQQLHLTGKFEKALKEYREALQKRQVGREKLHDIFSESLPEVAGAVVEGIPVAGPLLREGARVATSHLLKERQASKVQQDTELLENPIDDLTRAFVTELNHLADKNVILSSTGKTRQQRILLFFDTFEQLAAEAAPWFLYHFLTTQVSSNVVLVVAGRDPIEHTSPDDPKRWLPYCDDGTIYWISLNSFTEDETRTYLVKRGITDADRITNIWHLSRGLPLYLGLLTSNSHEKVDLTANVVANFLRWIPEQEQVKRQIALDAALFSRSFNLDDFEAFTYLPEHERPDLYRWLIGQPFVRSRDGRYSYHDLARELFSRHLYQHSRKGCYATRRVLANHYQRLLTEVQKEQGKEVYHSPEWLELKLALTYQLLLLPEEESHIKAVEQLLNAYEHAKTQQMGEIIRVLRELSQEQSSNQANSRARQIARHFLRYIEKYPKSLELVAAINYLLKLVDHEPTFSAELLAHIYCRRGGGHIKLKEYQQAIVDFDRALELDPNYIQAYLDRGELYLGLRKYQEAIDSLEQALELDPDNSTAHHYLGVVYRDLNDLQQAIAKLDRLVELHPDSSMVYKRRGWTHYLFEEYQQAIADLDHALELAPDNVEVYRLRGWAYLKLKEYQQAFADFDRGLDLDPNSILAYGGRGQVCDALGQYQRAIADFNRILDLDPLSTWAYHIRGRTYLELEEYQKAIEDFNRTLDLDPKYCWAYDGRGLAYLLLGDTKSAKSNYAAGWEQDLDVASATWADRWAAINCGWMAEWSGMCEERPGPKAAERLETIAATASKHYVAYVCRGVAKWLRGEGEESLAELEQAIATHQGGSDPYFWKGMVYASLEQDKEAITAIEKAIELELIPVLLAPLCWFEQDRPEFYEKYIAPLLTKYL